MSNIYDTLSPLKCKEGCVYICMLCDQTKHIFWSLYLLNNLRSYIYTAVMSMNGNKVLWTMYMTSLIPLKCKEGCVYICMLCDQTKHIFWSLYLLNNLRSYIYTAVMSMNGNKVLWTMYMTSLIPLKCKEGCVYICMLCDQTKHIFWSLYLLNNLRSYIYTAVMSMNGNKVLWTMYMTSLIPLKCKEGCVYICMACNQTKHTFWFLYLLNYLSFFYSVVMDMPGNKVLWAIYMTPWSHFSARKDVCIFAWFVITQIIHSDLCTS